MRDRTGMSNPDKTTLLTDPKGVKFETPWKLDFAHPHAITFCVLVDGEQRCLLVHHTRPHLYIYNALKACDPSGTLESWKKTFSDYGVEKAGGRLTRGMIEEFQRVSRKSNGFPRYKITSGRLWHGLKGPRGGRFHVMMMWDKKLAVPDGPPTWVAKMLKARGRVFLGASGKQGEWVALV